MESIRKFTKFTTSERKFTIAVDFDGVIRDKDTDGIVIDFSDPQFDSLSMITDMRKDHEVIVFTARHDLEQVANWLEDHGFPKLKITNRKPVAMFYLDDHAIRFEGSPKQALRDITIYTRGWQDH